MESGPTAKMNTAKMKHFSLGFIPMGKHFDPSRSFMKAPVQTLMLFSLLAAIPLHARTWTEAGTGRTLEGDFVKVFGNVVTIRKANGSAAQVPLTKLSDADQTFVKEQVAATKKPVEQRGDAKQQLLGTWRGFMAAPDGSPHGEIQLVITENEITASRGQQVMGAGTYSISSGDSKVQRIDGEGRSGQFAGKKYEGIFSVEGKTLKWCSANENPRSKRPDKLQTDTQAGVFLMVLEKE